MLCLCRTDLADTNMPLEGCTLFWLGQVSQAFHGLKEISLKIIYQPML